MSRLPLLNVESSPLDTLLHERRVTPFFLQGVFPFMGSGLTAPSLLHDDLTYRVPRDHTAVLIYLRAGNAAGELVYLSVVVNGRVRRYFPIAPQGDIHVPLAIREDIEAESQIELHLAAGKGLMGTLVVDAGFVLYEGERP